jgi:RNA polymerase sigma-70 factor (ECF subfamily)
MWEIKGHELPAANDPEPERALVEQAASGRGEARGQEALAQIYDRYFPRIYAYICYRTGRRQDAEDLVADIFTKVAEALEEGLFEWRHESSLAAWLFRIAHNAVVDHYRRASRQDEPVPLDDLPALEANNLLPDDALLRKEQFRHLHRLLNSLPSRRQEVITLKFFAALRNSEIAVLLGLDERTVASHLCRGLQDLHRLYTNEQVLEMDTEK